MLKTQLLSKIFQLELPWEEIEDILTGDFFGVLDYLPREPFLRDFVARVVVPTPSVFGPQNEGVRWDEVELVLWSRQLADDEQVEPDARIISNKWIIVIEVKLESGLGFRQPWTEYRIGQEIARTRS